MKQILFLLLLFAVTGCYTQKTPASPDESVLMIIDCRNDVSTKNTVLQQLRLARARDIVTEADGSFLTIKAACLLRETALYKIETIAAEIRDTPGVVQVDLRYNLSPVKQVN